jgi:hypothetical protein
MDPDIGAADFKRPGALQILTFEMDRYRTTLLEDRAVLHRRAPDDAVQRLSGDSDLLEADQLHR